MIELNFKVSIGEDGIVKRVEAESGNDDTGELLSIMSDELVEVLNDFKLGIDEKLFTGKVICLNPPDGMLSQYTVGKVYEVQSGSVVNDIGERRFDFVSDFARLRSGPTVEWMEVDGEVKPLYNGNVVLRKSTSFCGTHYKKNTVFSICKGLCLEDKHLNLENGGKFASFREFNEVNQGLFEPVFWAEDKDKAYANGKVFCVKAQEDLKSFTSGYVYPVVNGVLYGNDERMFTIFEKDIIGLCKNISGVFNGFFIPVVE